MKSGSEFKLPLPTQAVEVFKILEPVSFRELESYIFPSSGKYGYMAENTLRLALHRLGFKVTVHGMRSLITNVLNEKGFNRDAIERQLDHQEQNQTRASYLRSDFMEERIRIMQWFADWCSEDKTPTNVVELKRGVA
jgi:integrase